MSSPIRNLPDFIEKIKKIRDSLEQLDPTNNTDALVKFENQLALDELEECLRAKPEEFNKKAAEFLATRWERIGNSSASYTQQPLNKVNLLCVELANILSPLPADPQKYDELKMGEGPYFLLMPSLVVHETLYGVNIHQLKLHEFILSDDGKLFIPIMACLKRAYESETGEMRHLMMKPGVPLFPPLLTASEIARIAQHSPMVIEYYNLIEGYNKKRLHDSNLGVELDKLARALRAGGMHQGGQDEDSGAAANVGILKFTEFWENYPQEKKKWALEYYTNPSLEEALGRLMRPKDAMYQDTRFCVEIIEGNFISPIVSKIQREEGELSQLKEQISEQKKAIKEAMKSTDYTVKVNRNTVKQPQVLPYIFVLDESQQKEIFKHTFHESALYYALEYEPLALPQYFDLLDDTRVNELVTARTRDDDTALIIAAKAGGKESVELLLGADAEIEAFGEDKKRALHWAAINGHNDVVELLLQHGAEVDAETDHEKNTPLHLAITKGHANVVATLLKNGADVMIRNKVDSSLLHLYFWHKDEIFQNAFDLALRHHPELMEPLLFKGITLNAKQQKNCLSRIEGGTYDNVLLYAAVFHPLLLDDLVEELKKQSEDTILSILGSRNSEGKTLLMLAAGLGRIKSVQNLLEMGADIKEYSTHLSSSVLHEAASSAHNNVVELVLTKALEEERAELLTHPDAQGNTVLHVAVPNGGQVVATLLAHGADINARNHAGDNPLDVAIQKQDSKLIVPLLLKANTLTLEKQKSCLSNIENGAYENVLSYAMCEQPDAINELLLANGQMEQCLAGHKAMEQFFDVDAHIASFQEKLKEMEQKARRNYRYDSAVNATKTLIRELKLAKAEFILTEGMSIEDKKVMFKQRCLDAAQLARPVLETHRELAKRVASLILVLLTLPISIPLLVLGVFSLKTQSAQKLNWLKEDLEDKTTPSNNLIMGQA
ncbi:ankyrin repeat domain-containing protein [Legionella maioricensis]|uniref:Ankyrin repeat domain-containing protein n=1 Tax=Legionella maioricensis TaxID=2896528 RepID=A0A9X2IC38_9GAMM|nr:ankyrin repeat domain-containing protein [Legionella maioricensis]MCL9684846.1 ankyrin repeat domain-containing protein [Legionella maioricensis]MCL9688526.1 ankyrin repeat domain-containing protein [Legionella maioricensis]